MCTNGCIIIDVCVKPNYHVGVEPVAVDAVMSWHQGTIAIWETHWNWGWNANLKKPFLFMKSFTVQLFWHRAWQCDCSTRVKFQNNWTTERVIMYGWAFLIFGLIMEVGWISNIAMAPRPFRVAGLNWVVQISAVALIIWYVAFWKSTVYGASVYCSCGTFLAIFFLYVAYT